MTPSKYQAAIFDALQNTNDNLIVQAVAGSGKSTTLEHGVGRLPNVSTGMFAFNKDIAVALEKRMESAPKPDNISFGTINAFGWAICRQSTKIKTVSKYKDDAILQYFLDMDDPKDKALFYKWRFLMGRVISLLKANLYFEAFLTEEKVQEICDNYGMDLPTDVKFIELIQQTWEASSGRIDIMNFNDQIYMPLKHGWHVPQFEVAMVDELQDLNPAQQELMLRAGKRFIGVGDTRQAIYNFAGADSSGIKTMLKRTNGRELPLSVCYRCPVNVVKEAQKIVPYMEWCDSAPQGIVDTIKTEKFRQMAEPGDFVLCRTTAPLVSECLRMIREGKAATVKGRDIGDQLISLIEKLGVKPSQPTTRLYDAVCRYQMEESERLSRANRTELITALEDRVETVKVLLEGSREVSGVIDKIKEIFSDKIVGVMFSTIHKAKGLESPRVSILRPDLLPHPNAKTPTQEEQEENLKYVAVTRAMFSKKLGRDGELYMVEKA